MLVYKRKLNEFKHLNEFILYSLIAIYIAYNYYNIGYLDISIWRDSGEIEMIKKLNRRRYFDNYKMNSMAYHYGKYKTYIFLGYNDYDTEIRFTLMNKL